MEQLGLLLAAGFVPGGAVPNVLSRLPTGGWLDQLRSLGGGTGILKGRTGDFALDKEIAQRMHYQDLAVICLLGVAYIVTLGFGWMLLYRMGSSTSPVCYYCDPRFHPHASLSREPQEFLRAFNEPPGSVVLSVCGFHPAPEEGTRGAVKWRGQSYVTAFHFTLDLRGFMQEYGSISQEDRRLMERFLNSENSLRSLRILKDTSWEGWEELATNVKLKIRQDGFWGPIDVRLVGGSDELRVFRNHTWANFMLNRTAKTLFMLSVVGYFLYVPYMSLRCKRETVRSQFKVRINTEQFWKLIQHGLSRNGFQGPSGGSFIGELGRQQQQQQQQQQQPASS